MGENRLSSSNIMDNEIIKTVDINDGFDAQINNIAKAFKSLLENKNDFVIGPENIVEIHSDAENDWALNINPVMGVSQLTGQIFMDSEKNIAACNVIEPTGYDRIDTIEIRGSYIETDNQQRAFIDFDNNTKQLGYVNTKRELAIEAQVVNYGAASVEAPNHTKGWVKVAEIFVPANATKISDCIIYNITSDVSGLPNENWTNQKDSTYNVNYISDINKRYRQEHNFDGTHKENVIHIKQLDTGTGATQVNGNNIPTGGINDVSDTHIEATSSLYNTLLVFADKINDLYKEYLKDGKYHFNSEVVIKGNDSETFDLDFLKIGMNKDGSAYIKLGDKTIFTILPDGKLRAAKTYIAENEFDLVNKKVTNQLKDYLDSVENRVSIIEENLDQSQYTNEVLGRFKIDYSTEIAAATMKNQDLHGAAVIDGVDCNEGAIVLVKSQDNKKENGIYKVSLAESGWERLTDYTSPSELRYKLFIVKSGTANKNRIFYCPIENFIDEIHFGTDDITFVQYMGAIDSIPNTIPVRDEKGHVKAKESTSNNDCIVRSELFTKEGAIAKAIIDYIYPIGSLYFTSSEDDPYDIFGVGSWRKIEGRFIFGADGSHPNGTNGGNEFITLTKNQLPTHTHKFIGDKEDTGNQSNNHTHEFNWNGNHTHSVSDGGHSHSYEDTVWVENDIRLDGDSQAQGCNTRSHGMMIGSKSGYDQDNKMSAYINRSTRGSGCGISLYGTNINVRGSTGGISADHTHSFTPHGTNAETGGSAEVNIMNLYESKNIWERIA